MIICVFLVFLQDALSAEIETIWFAENSEISGGRQVLVCAKDLTILSMAGRYKQPVQYGKRVHSKTRAWGAPSSLGIYMYAI